MNEIMKACHKTLRFAVKSSGDKSDGILGKTRVQSAAAIPAETGQYHQLA